MKEEIGGKKAMKRRGKKKSVKKEKLEEKCITENK